MGECHYIDRSSVRQLDMDAMRISGISGLILMENAGRQCADKLEALAWGKKAAILAGGGNNGGDGFVIARHLLLRGYEVAVFLLSPRKKIRGDALVNLGILDRIGATTEDMSSSDSGAMLKRWQDFDFLVDAIGGTGITGPLRDSLAGAVKVANSTGLPILAVDIPSGLDCDTGLPTGDAIRAAVTVTFVAMKAGFAHACSKEYTGQVFVADIGISPSMLDA